MPKAQKADLGEFVTDVLLPGVNNDGPIFVPEALLLVRRYLITEVPFVLLYVSMSLKRFS